MTPPRVLGRARWRYLRHPGTEAAVLSQTDRGFHLSGKAHLRFPEGPTIVKYAIACDPAWRPQLARVDLSRGRSEQFLDVRISDQDEWEINGFRQREFRGCTDFDLSASPSTNTLAVRRLQLPVGGTAEIQTGWVVFPDLEVRSVRQRYHRMSEHRYRYEGLHNGFVGEFGVDEVGLVTDYPGFWEPLSGSEAPVRKPNARPRRGHA